MDPKSVRTLSCIVTGNTPNKPREKRTRDDNEARPSVELEERPARRTLDFHRKGSPLQKMLVIFLVHQLIHDARESVQGKSKASLLKMLLVVDVEPDGSPIVEMPNRDIPVSVILELHQLRGSGLSLEDVVTNIRVSLVPPGYEPCPFGSNTDESVM